MSEKRFVQSWNMHRGVHYFAIEDTQEKKMYCVEQYIVDVEEVADLLNEQQATINKLKERLEKINGGYGHLTHRNGLTANEWLIQSQEKEIKKKDKQISEWIEQHSKDIAKISEQNKLIQKLKEENEQLKNELRKEKLLLEYSDSMYNADLIVNIRYSNGEWKADVSVIDNE